MGQFGSSNVYIQQAGNNGSGAALWNVDFAVNLCQNGTCASDAELFSEYFVLLKVDTDPTAAVDYAFPPIPALLFGGNSWGDNSTAQSGGREGLIPAPGEYILQNSQNIGFFPINLLRPIDPNVTGIYNFKLEVRAMGTGALQGSTEIQVQVVPIPAAAWLFGSALIGLVGVGRRRKA